MTESSDMLKRRKALIARLRRQKPINVGRWTREELYERSDPPRPDNKDTQTPAARSPIAHR